MNSTTNSNRALERVLRDLGDISAYPPLETLQDKKILEEEDVISSVSSTVDQSSCHSLSDKEESQLVTQKAVSFDWDKSLKTVSKEDKPLQTFNSSPVVVRITKPTLPDDQNAHDAQIPKRKDRKNLYNNFKGTKKSQPKTPTLKKSLPKSQIQPKPIEEVKEEIIEEPKDVTQKTVNFDWEKPLKKIFKEDKPLQTFNSSTVVVRVIKPALPDNQDAHDAQIPKRKDRKNFYNNFKDIKKNQPKTPALKKSLPKPQTQPKPIEEVKEEIIEVPPRNLGDWTNPATLKKSANSFDKNQHKATEIIEESPHNIGDWANSATLQKPATNPSKKITTGIKLSQTQTLSVTKGSQKRMAAE